MPSRDEVEQLRAVNAELSRLIDAELSDFFASVRDSPPDVVRDALLDFIPSLVSEYGDVAATASAEWFEQVYGGRVPLAPTVSREVAERGVKYVAGQLWTPTPLEAFSALSVKVDKWVKQPGRDTLNAAAGQNGMRWVRVPKGEHTCAFCLMMASRSGAWMYYSKEAAGDTGKGVGDDYHGKCDCAVVPVRDADDLPNRTEMDEYYSIYDAAAEAAGTRTDTRAILMEMRRQNPTMLTDGVVRAA